MGKLRDLGIDCPVNKPWVLNSLFRGSSGASLICFKMPVVTGASRQVCPGTGTMLWAFFASVWFLWVCLFVSFLARYATYQSFLLPLSAVTLLLQMQAGCLCSQRSSWPDLLALLCTTSLTCCWEPKGYFTWTALSFLMVSTLLQNSPQHCQLWWCEASQPLGGERRWLSQQNGHLSNGVECPSLSYVPLSVSSSLWTGIGIFILWSWGSLYVLAHGREYNVLYKITQKIIFKKLEFLV